MPNRETTQEVLRAVLAERAARLGISPETIRSPAPGALTARRPDGSLLRLDFRDYQPSEIAR
jgi:hypothetical protein